jgi:hypothetical protein
MIRAWAGAAACAGAAAAGAVPAQVDYRNLTAGGPLRPGIYGRIEVRQGPPPPLVYDKPVVARQPLVPTARQPVYLYVPPGQLRRWPQHCARWNACEQPVLFVRMDDSPSRLGDWKQRSRPEALSLREALERFAP